MTEEEHTIEINLHYQDGLRRALELLPTSRTHLAIYNKAVYTTEHDDGYNEALAHAREAIQKELAD